MKCIAEIEGLKNIDVMIMGDKRKFRIVGGRIIKSIYEKMTWLMQIKDLKTGCIYDMDLEVLIKLPEKHDDDINPKYEILIIGEDETPIDNFTLWGTLEMTIKLAEVICEKFAEAEEKNVIQVMIYKTIKEVE